MEVNKPVRPPEPVPAWPGHRRAKEFQTKGTRVDGGGGYPGDYPGGDGQGFRKSLAALALLADKLKSHGQIVFKITYILSKFCPKCLRKT